ncbi:MAG: hypothetical protein HW398_1137 [Acidobacteria bacterium]|nr:hypothetical protein [Acidobacteriota bacterium]
MPLLSGGLVAAASGEADDAERTRANPLTSSATARPTPAFPTAARAEPSVQLARRIAFACRVFVCCSTNFSPSSVLLLDPWL